MSEESFSLICFPATHTPDFSITGHISLQKNIVHLHYSLTGSIEDILLPPASVHPGRKDDLWKSTCFEFFLAIKGQPRYWEFNMSPSGDWNVYRMDAYRRIGFREETSIQLLPFEIKKEAGELSLGVQIDLNPLLQPNQFLDFGITAVVQTLDGAETFWALAHPAPVADFHLRESFILELAEEVPLSSQSGQGG
jgi:hypothetical protein